MLRPFWCNDSTTTLRTLDDWLATHGDLSLSPTPTVACAQSRRRTSFSMMPHRKHPGAPRVITPLAGLVHDRESAADYEHNHIRTATKGEFIATSLASRASSAQRPIVACAYAAGLN